jgi:rare lipoprotein A
VPATGTQGAAGSGVTPAAPAVTSAILAGAALSNPKPAGVPPAILPAPVTSTPVRTLFVQAGAFAEPGNAQRLAERLRGAGYGKVFVRDDLVGGRRLYRVRIGPIPDVPHFDRVVEALERAGVRDAHLALD